MAPVSSLLYRDVNPFRQVDRLLSLSPGTARRWMDGSPALKHQLPQLVREVATGKGLVTWGEHVETRLVWEYRREPHRGGRTTCGHAIQKLREEFGTDLPAGDLRAFRATRRS